MTTDAIEASVVIVIVGSWWCEVAVLWCEVPGMSSDMAAAAATLLVSMRVVSR